MSLRVKGILGGLLWLLLSMLLVPGVAFAAPTVQFTTLAPPWTFGGGGGPEWHVASVSEPTNLPPAQDSVQSVRVSAQGGTFTLAYAGESTGPLAFDASAAAVAGALNGLSSLRGLGAKVTVTGGPGPSAPFTVTFAGGLTGLKAKVLTVNGVGLTGSGAAASVSVVTPGGPGEGGFWVFVTNVGSQASSGPVSIKDVLPAKLEVVSIESADAYREMPAGGHRQHHPEPGNREELSCAVVSVTCAYSESVPPGDTLFMYVHVLVPRGTPASVQSTVSMSGGGAPEASATETAGVTATPAPFGLAAHSLIGSGDLTQAGAHGDLTNMFVANTDLDPRGVLISEGALKTIEVGLPRGLVGNTVAVGRCEPIKFHERDCPSSTIVGVETLLLSGDGSYWWQPVPVYNLVPPQGTVAELGFEPIQKRLQVYVSAHVRTGGDYGVTAVSAETPELANVMASSLTVWGVPAEHSGPGPYAYVENSYNSEFDGTFGGAIPGVNDIPFMSNPTDCSGPLATSFLADSWGEPGSWLSLEASAPAITDCGALDFSPSIEVRPHTTVTSSPTGLHVDLHVPQNEVPHGLSEANVRDTRVRLPEGLTVNPSSASGLVACPLLKGSESHPGMVGIDLENPEPANCPDASKLGTVEVDTPLVDHPLAGAVYVAAQNANPFGSLLALYIAIHDPVTGVVVKVAGKVELDPATGQLTTTFDETPELPFEDFKIDFYGGERAPLATGPSCGQQTTTADLTPWTSPQAPDALLTSSFQMNAGCGPLPFAPSVTAGTVNNEAGAFSPFTVAFSRKDGEQYLHGVSVTLPPGVLAKLAGIPECPEEQANAGTCSEASLIGESGASSGVGQPIWVTGGHLYLTGPYAGAPFGLSIVVPAKAGPFDLGDVVIRAKIQIDPLTAQATVTTDASGPYSIPSIIDGIPVYIRTVYATVNRPGFTFNPTNCDPETATGNVTSTTGTVMPVSTPFQAANCAALAFKPTFKVSTNGKTSRQIGASLHVTLSYPKTAWGSEANIHYVKVDLPKQLPSNLKTLQQACPAATFEANPAACDAGSRVGTVLVHTPVLSVPLTGPAYFVSHGGQAFPELVFVLQGDGVTVQVHAETFINEHTNITSSTIHNAPDVPFETFELNLPQGQYSALSAPSNLCAVTKTVMVKKKITLRATNGQKRTVTRKVDKTVAGTLVMPTAFTAQNGAQIHQNTPIEVSGCPKAKKTNAHKSIRKRHR